MRVLALVTEAFGGRGGIAQYNRDLLTALCHHPECTQVVAVPRLSRDPTGVLPSTLCWVSEATRSRFWFCVQLIKLIVSGTRFDLIICGHINLLPLAWAMRLLNRAPLIMIVYGIDAWHPTGRWIVDGLVNRVDKLIAISSLTRDRIASWSGIRAEAISIVPNAIHMELFGVCKPKEDLVDRYDLSNSSVLLTLGRLSAAERYKGIDEVLEVLPELIEQIPNLKYIVGGDGDDVCRLQEKSLELGIADRVIFTGYIAENEKLEYYSLANAFVMPGRGEGFGFVFLEAMACGIPVVASKLDGSREAVRDGEIGVLVDPDNRLELKAGILQALGRPREIPVGLEYFSFSNFVKKIHAVVDSTLFEHSG